jgi:hypothetical protein
MDFEELITSLFVPSPAGAVAPPTVRASPARRLRDAIEPLAMHAVWSKTTNERLQGLGLDFLGAYLWGRAAALGQPEPGVVVSSFAVFEPSLVVAAYNQARRTCGHDELLAARTEATIASLAEVLGDVPADRIAGAADAMQAAVGAADSVGRPLFSGLSGQPWPTEPVGRLWHACELAREHRGDSHVAVCVARGLGPIEMNILTELWVGMPLGSYTATRGWPAEATTAAADRLRKQGLLDGDRLSVEGQRYRDGIEADTDRIDRRVVDGLGTDADRIIGLLDDWSQRCISARAFPPDVYKRAAG